MSYVTEIYVQIERAAGKKSENYETEPTSDGGTAGVKGTVPPGADPHDVLDELLFLAAGTVDRIERGDIPNGGFQSAQDLAQRGNGHPPENGDGRDREIRVKLDPGEDNFEAVKAGLKDRDFEWDPGAKVWHITLDASLAQQVKAWLDGEDVDYLERGSP